MEQEVEMWKNTAAVYKRRYEAMHRLVLLNALCVSIIGILIIGGQIVKLVMK